MSYNPQKGLIVHSLLATASITGGEKNSPLHLENILRRLRRPDVVGAEIAYHPAMFSANVTEVVAARSATMAIRAFCAFFGAGDLDPLDVGDLPQVLARLETIAELCTAISQQTGQPPPVVTGPWAFQIAKKYSRSSVTTTAAVLRVLDKVTELAERTKVTFCLEGCLRPAENSAIQGPDHMYELLPESQFILGHEDTFHHEAWGVKTEDVLRNHHKKIGWLHTSGKRRHSPGNASDDTDYESIGVVLAETGWTGGICFEGFGPEFRAAVPEIGKGFPKDLPAEAAIAMAVHTLKAAKVIV
jgi:hypothetical protein